MNSQLLRGIGMTSQRTRERLIQRLVDQGISDQRVLEVMRTTPRHIFVDEALAHRAYEDTALPIGLGQTLSQPHVVARMTELLLSEGPMSHVLEVGTGSGYQTAVLAQLVGRVSTVERIHPFVEIAQQRFQQLGLSNIQCHASDGRWGWPERGPFDGILVTAAPEQVPKPLFEQLAVGGRMVIPVGGSKQQELYVITRQYSGFTTERLDPVLFVPLTMGEQR